MVDVKSNIKKQLVKYVNELSVISTVELGKKCGVSKQAVAKWLNGECIPSVNCFEIICDTFGISINEFLGIDDSSELSDEEKVLIKKYRENKLMHEAVKKLLNI